MPPPKNDAISFGSIPVDDSIAISLYTYLSFNSDNLIPYQVVQHACRSVFGGAASSAGIRGWHWCGVVGFRLANDFSSQY